MSTLKSQVSDAEYRRIQKAAQRKLELEEWRARQAQRAPMKLKPTPALKENEQ